MVELATFFHEPAVSGDYATAVVERYLIALAGDAPADPIVRALPDRAVGRMRFRCANLLHRSYLHLARPPLDLQTDEVSAAVVGRLLKAMREPAPGPCASSSVFPTRTCAGSR